MIAASLGTHLQPWWAWFSHLYAKAGRPGRAALHTDRAARDGTLRYTTRSGITHVVAAAELPVCDNPEAARWWQRLVESPPTCSELAEAIDNRRHARVVADTELEAQRRAETTADYRLSYPGATDEDIEDWVWGPDTEMPNKMAHECLRDAQGLDLWFTCSHVPDGWYRDAPPKAKIASVVR